MIAVQRCFGLQMCCVEAGIRFGDREAGFLATGDQRRQPTLLLLVVTEHHDRVQPENIHV